MKWGEMDEGGGRDSWKDNKKKGRLNKKKSQREKEEYDRYLDRQFK